MIPGIEEDSLVYLNGEFLPVSEAKISVLDRGFIFGDGVYEVVPAYHGKPFRLEHHVSRLQKSLKEIRIETGKTAQDWQDLMTEMVQRSSSEYTIVYLQVTRGVAKREHGFPTQRIEPTIFMMGTPFSRPSQETLTKGLRTVSMEDMRWLRCDIKSVSLLGNVLAKQYAVDHGADDVIMFRDGQLTETSSANIWVVKDNKVFAPLRDNLILEGVRYAFAQELCAQQGIEFEARPITKQEVCDADEILLTAATKEILAITEFDGKPVGSGQPGPIFQTLRQAYDEVLEKL